MCAAEARWVYPTGLLALLVVAAAVRLPGLARTGFSSDEAVYVGQGVALAGERPTDAVRAHPPLFGVLLDVLPGAGRGDLGPRAVGVALGLVGVLLAALLGRELAGRAAGLVAGGVVALMPYHVDVTRLALVEVPMAAAAAGGLLLVVRAARVGGRGRVEAAAVVLGVATLFKETAALTALAVALAVLVRDPRLPRAVLARAAAWYLGVVALYPLWLLGTGGLPRALSYLAWQTGRGGSASGDLYVDLVAPRVGWVVVLAAVAGGVLLLRRRVPGATPVVLAVVVPLTFYVAWPVQGYPYLLALVVPGAALAGTCAAAVADLVVRAGAGHRGRRPAAWLVALGLAVTGPALAAADPPAVAGAGGVPGVREASVWLAAEGTREVVTGSPWVANIVRHYVPDARVRSLGDPGAAARRNPADRTTSTDTLPAGPLAVVWDAWSAGSDPAGTRRLLADVRRRGGHVAHVERATAARGGRVLVVVLLLDS